ncbi:type I methionyl aminopeptidase [Omnitrophica bacterium]|nr:type I methionyl aminopeptidase [Candidatus Omnitrophota bacterium]
MISLKSKEEIELMKKAGRVIAKALGDIEKIIRPGMTTIELDKKTKKIITKEGCTPAFKGYKGFPGNICTSINDAVVHGIPKEEVLKEGDILSIDVGAMYDGYYADGARTYKVGRVSKTAAKLIDVTKESLFAGIKEAMAGERLSNISHAIQDYVESHGYSVVRALVGHGIGSKIHENPEIPNFGKPNNGPLLKPGMTLAIEPMVNEGTYEVEILDDGWTVVTKDRKLSAHFEHTVLITEGEPEILTL